MKYELKHCPVNPSLEYADEYILPEGVTEIVSQGGGSTIDVGKWLANKFNLKHTAIPTTAGTGSEVTKFCVLMVDGKKKTFDLKEPDNYILNPDLVVTLPQKHTIASGLDAFSQALESSWSKNATAQSKLYADTAVNMVPKALIKSITAPEDRIARMDMLIAANLSGRAINITRTNVCHAISYPITEKWGIPHGVACAMSLGYFAKKFAKLDLTEFLKMLGVPRLSTEQAQEIAKIAIESEKLKDCPQEVTEVDIALALV
jgi:alcohol dehydrogenase class IV